MLGLLKMTWDETWLAVIRLGVVLYVPDVRGNGQQLYDKGSVLRFSCGEPRRTPSSFRHREDSNYSMLRLAPYQSFNSTITLRFETYHDRRRFSWPTTASARAWFPIMSWLNPRLCFASSSSVSEEN